VPLAARPPPQTILRQVWDKLGEPFLKTTSEAEVVQAFEAYAPQYPLRFVPSLVRLIFEVVHHPKFPKRREPQIKLFGGFPRGLRNGYA